MLDELRPDALAAIRDYCSDYVKDRKAFSDFKRAWVDMVVDPLACWKPRPVSLGSSSAPTSAGSAAS